MLLTNENKTYKIDVYLAPSFGLGVFSNQFVPKGTVIWAWNDEAVKVLTEEEAKEYWTHVYQCSETKRYIMCTDMSRFENHSENPNTESQYLGDDVVTVTTRDIQKGEEITGNYKLYDLLWKYKLPVELHY